MLGEAEVDQLDVALLVYEHVLGLEITIHDVHLVQFFEAQEHLGEVEARYFLVELHTHISHQLVEFSAGQELEHKIQMLPVLECVEHVAEEVGRLKLLHNVRFIFDVLDVLAALHLILAYAFERVHFIRGRMTH